MKISSHRGLVRILLLAALGSPAFAAATLPSLPEALRAPRDIWGEAAMAQPNGASYEFLAPLLPPPRYVHADFRHYPLVLSAPNARHKARLISNGSGVNLAGGARSWHANGIPFTFRVGPDTFLFGGLSERLSEPTLAEGWLPIPEIRYTHRSPFRSEGHVPLDVGKVTAPPEIYRLEAFASTAPELAEHAVVFVRFDLAQGTNGILTVDADARDLTFADGRLTDVDGRVVGFFDGAWKQERGRLVARLTSDSAAVLAIPTEPLPASLPLTVDLAAYAQHRAACVATWREIADFGMQVEIPEPRVNHAWRNALAQIHGLIQGSRLHYSAGNQYDGLYVAEGSDTAQALLIWGHDRDFPRLLGPILERTRKGLEQHQATFKLGNLIRHYWQTRDPSLLRELRARWEQEVDLLDRGRIGEGGLFPPEQYCGDIHTRVQSLNANSKAWRTLRDMGALLTELGETERGHHFTTVASQFRQVVLKAIERSAVRTTNPPFVPIALDGGEPAHSPILHSRIGSYWNVIIGYTLGSGLFPSGSPQATWIPRYQEQHGGIFLGMVRSGGAQFNFWTGEDRVNPLYGTRYMLDTLRRDEPERALVSFYGTLAQGLTRNTFVGGEGSTLDPVDDRGRFFYCPPNSAASAHVLHMLRNMLVQDWDVDDDGRPDTLRLLFGTSRRWLEDGKAIRVERAPTPFGEVTVRARSRLAAGEVLADVTLPKRQTPDRILLRIRVPEGWRLTGASNGTKSFTPDGNGTIDLTGLHGQHSIRFTAERH